LNTLVAAELVPRGTRIADAKLISGEGRVEVFDCPRLQ
jgi:hypothetical protein